MNLPWEEHWRDYLNLLGLQPGFSEAQLKAAYRTKARTHHPDACPGDKGAHGRFLLIAEALEVLRDPRQREGYLEVWRAKRASRAGASNAPPPPPEPRRRPTTPCSRPGCRAHSEGACASCGAKVCAGHRHVIFTPNGGKAPGGYCPDCLPRCSCGAYFDPEAPSHPRAKAQRVRRARAQGPLCESCLGTICDDESCARPKAHSCKKCGKGLCADHAVHAEGGHFCSACVERCRHCHAPIMEPTPNHLRPAEVGLREGNGGKDRWCPDCLTHAPLFSCSRCGRDQIAFGKMAQCKPCGGQWLCDKCHPAPSAPCPRCRQIERLERKARFWRQRIEWSYFSCMAVSCVTPMILFLGKHKLLEALRIVGQFNRESLAMVVVFLMFLIPSCLVGIIPGFCLGHMMAASLKGVAASYRKRADALRKSDRN